MVIVQQRRIPSVCFDKVKKSIKYLIISCIILTLVQTNSKKLFLF